MALIEKQVKKTVAEMLGVSQSEVGDNFNFEHDGAADSLDKIELVMGLEQEFELEIPDEDAEKIETVGQAIAWIKAHAPASATK